MIKETIQLIKDIIQFFTKALLYFVVVLIIFTCLVTIDVNINKKNILDCTNQLNNKSKLSYEESLYVCKKVFS
jgi:ABC-type maltose transport system permease subunit